MRLQDYQPGAAGLPAPEARSRGAPERSPIRPAGHACRGGRVDLSGRGGWCQPASTPLDRRVTASTRRNRNVWLALCGVALLSLGAGRSTPPLPTVPHVDLARYAGRWHEIARLPNCFQRSCACSQAVYTPRGAGCLGVVNTCTTARGRCRRVEGHAEPVPGSGNARLRVRFEGLAALAPVPCEGNYWIIALDDDYRWAMVGTPDRRFLWILARDPSLDADTFGRLVGQARCLGFDVEELVTRGR